MDNYRKAAHTTFMINIHSVWITKYRKAVLLGDIANRTRELIKETCKKNKVGILSGFVSKDHVHLLVSMPPDLPVSQLVQFIKGYSSRKLFEEFVELKKQFLIPHLWARGYFAGSCGKVTEEVVISYIQNQNNELQINSQEEFELDI